MTDKEIADKIAQGIAKTGVEGSFGSVSCSTAGDYPSMGVSQWEGLGGRGDNLLHYLDGGDRFAGRSYSDIRDSGELPALKALLDSQQGHIAQLMLLSADAANSYVPALRDGGLTELGCMIYAGIWCPTSHYVVSRFLARRLSRGYAINNLEQLHAVFKEQYAVAAEVPENCYEGYRNRADITYHYCSSLRL